MLILILTAYSCFKGEGGGANWSNYDIVYKWSIGWAHTHIEGEAHKGGYNNVLFIQRFPGKHRRLLLFVTKKYFYSLQNRGIEDILYNLLLRSAPCSHAHMYGHNKQGFNTIFIPAYLWWQSFVWNSSHLMQKDDNIKLSQSSCAIPLTAILCQLWRNSVQSQLQMVE